MSIIIRDSHFNNDIDISQTPFCREISIGNQWISRKDFVQIVKYFLTNADLVEDDEREKLVNEIRDNVWKIPGYNIGNQRLSFVTLKVSKHIEPSKDVDDVI